MTDHYTTSINARDLTSRLNQVETQSSNATPGASNMSPRSRSHRASSLDSYPLPSFSKSSTMSTTDSGSSGHLHITPAVPRIKAHRESVEVGVGEFSKPRVNKRSRRDTGASAKSEGGNEDFRYYGRHGNQWLFNDFSVTESIKKGWGKMFRKDGEEQGDWYEKRN
jgi:hypothetical protein